MSKKVRLNVNRSVAAVMSVGLIGLIWWTISATVKYFHLCKTGTLKQMYDGYFSQPVAMVAQPSVPFYEYLVGVLLFIVLVLWGFHVWSFLDDNYTGFDLNVRHTCEFIHRKDRTKV